MLYVLITNVTFCARFIFLDLDFASVARGFALLRLPKMPELRGKNLPDFTEMTVDTDTIRYKDKSREKQRQKMLAELAELREKDVTPFPKKNFIKNKSWSKQKTKKERRKKRVAKRKHDEVFPLNVMIKTKCITGLDL